MFHKTWLAILRVALLAAFVGGLSLPAAGVRADEDAGLYLHLQAGTFDPLAAEPEIPSAFTYSAEQVEQSGTYLLQFTGPVLDEWKAALESAGALIGPYVPDYAFLVYLDAPAKAQVTALPFVRWVGPFQPAYKLAPGMDFSQRSYRVILAPWADKQQVGVGLSAFSPSLAEEADGYTALLDTQGIQLAAMRPEVVWIEPIDLMRVNNDIGGGTIMGGATTWGRGYDGAGIEIAVADTGLDTGAAGTIHLDFAGRIGDISSWPVQNIDWGCGAPLNIAANDTASDLDSGHGTHVTGSVAGDGTRSGGLIKGLAHEATINMQATEQYTNWPTLCDSYGLYDGYYLTGLPADARTLLLEAYNWGARIHNNSWGDSSRGVYDQTAADFDDFISTHRDFTVMVSAGNAGIDDNADGYVDIDSIGSPATAKNVITIGASDNERASGGYAGLSWNYLWGSDYPTNPTRDDVTSDTRNELAAFSSRGPTDDGRIKPDLVAPGTNILSTKSSQTSATGWGAYNSYYMYMGGTSMASPLSAGAATLVRDFLITAKNFTNPSAALIKATLINSAVDMGGYGNASYEAGLPIPNNHEGWGRIDVAAATTSTGRKFTDNTAGLSTAGTATYTFDILAGTPFKASLVWSDPDAVPLAATTLVNNLNLTVTAPGGASYKGNVFAGGWTQPNTGVADAVNNVENVYVQSPAAGTWTVTVTGANVPQGPQPFALVVSANYVPVDMDNFVYLPLIMRGYNMGAPVLSDVSPTVSTGSYTLYWSPTGDVPSSYDIEENSVVTTMAYVGTSKAYTSRPVGVYTYRVRGRYGTATGPWSAAKSVSVVVAQQTVVTNPGFESGRNVGWSEYSSNGWEIVGLANSTPVGTAHGGSWLAWLGGDYSDTSHVQQSIAIKAGSAVLSYWYYVASEDACGFDYFYVKVNGTTKYTHNLCSSNDTSGWVNKKVDLNAYAGQTVTLRFEVVTDDSLNSNMFLDDISFVATLTDEVGTAEVVPVDPAVVSAPRKR